MKHKWIFIGLCFVLICIFLAHLMLDKGRRQFSSEYEKLLSLSMRKISLIEKFNRTNRSMCTTKWYKQLNFEFNTFSVNNFEKVMFLMDDSYVNISKDRLYKCIFFQFGKRIFSFSST
jgi:hypothetical protein